MDNPTITIKHGDNTVTTTLEGLKMAADQLEGMPSKVPHLVEKITGTLSEGYSHTLPAIGDMERLEIDARVKSITERKNKDAEKEYVVLFEVVDMG